MAEILNAPPTAVWDMQRVSLVVLFSDWQYILQTGASHCKGLVQLWAHPLSGQHDSIAVTSVSRRWESSPLLMFFPPWVSGLTAIHSVWFYRVAGSALTCRRCVCLCVRDEWILQNKINHLKWGLRWEGQMPGSTWGILFHGLSLLSLSKRHELIRF